MQQVMPSSLTEVVGKSWHCHCKVSFDVVRVGPEIRERDALTSNEPEPWSVGCVKPRGADDGINSVERSIARHQAFGLDAVNVFANDLYVAFDQTFQKILPWRESTAAHSPFWR